MPRKKKEQQETRHFVVEGRAQAKQRPRLFRGVAYTPQQTRDYEQKMRNAYVDAHGDKEPFLGDLIVDVFVYFQKRNHGDLDNYEKCMDGLNQIAWKDDKQIKELHGYLIVDKEEEERMEIFIRPVESTWLEKVKDINDDLTKKSN